MANYTKVFLKIGFIILVATLVNIIINYLLKKLISNSKNKTRKTFLTTMKLTKRLKTLVIYVICLIACLFQVPEFNTVSWSILSGAGVLSIVLGYAAQKTLSNLFCGLGIAFSDPFEIGDFISCVDLDISGYVEDITLRHTIVRTVTNKRVIIPNSRMDDMTIENYNHTDNEVCIYIEYPISYSSDVDLALSILKEEVGKLYNPNENGINKNVEFPKVRIVKWDESSIILRGWIWGDNHDTVFENIFHLNYIIKKRFDEEGIEIPYNYLNIVDRTEGKNKKK